MSRRDHAESILLLAVVFFSAGFPTSTSAGMPPGLPIECPGPGETWLDRQLNEGVQWVRYQCGLGSPYKPWLRITRDGWIGPLDVGTNVNVITGDESAPNFTQSESTDWSSDGNKIVVVYNDDSNANGLLGVSYSTDGGATFTRIRPSPFEQGHDGNLGDPILVYNARLQTFLAGGLVASMEGCGPIPAVGIGLWQSTMASTGR